MRNCLIGLALAGTLVLGGCAGNRLGEAIDATTKVVGAITSVPGGLGGISDAVLAVQERAAQVCAFLPTAQTVAAIFAKNNATVSTVSDVATAICNAVTRPRGPRSGPPKVLGVPIRGQKLRRPAAR